MKGNALLPMSNNVLQSMSNNVPQTTKPYVLEEMEETPMVGVDHTEEKEVHSFSVKSKDLLTGFLGRSQGVDQAVLKNHVADLMVDIIEEVEGITEEMEDITEGMEVITEEMVANNSNVNRYHNNHAVASLGNNAKRFQSNHVITFLGRDVIQ